jgi:hypothetical protein
MKLNRSGLILCSVYVAFSALLFLVMYSSQDTKSVYVAGQIAVLPAILLFSALGLEHWVIVHPWADNFPVHFIISLVLCYLLGWVLSRLAKSVRSH